MIINGFMLSLLFAYFIGRSFYNWLSCSPNKGDSLILRCHSLFLGLGITSLLFWLYTVLFNGVNACYPICEFVLIIWLLYRENSGHNCIKADVENQKIKSIFFPDLIAFILILCVALLCIAFLKNKPNGHWDALAMWNLKAVFLSDGNYSVWQRMFDDSLYYIHRDYPLFLPATITRSFVFSGAKSSIVPALYALIFTCSCCLLVYLYLRKLRSGYLGVIALILLSARTNIIWEGSRQYADLPLMVFILISLYEYILWLVAKEKTAPSLCIIFSSLALWTKNEGIVFFLLISLWLYKNFNLSFKRLLGYFSFVIPVFVSKCLVIYFAKSPNDLMFACFSRLGNFFEVSRYLYLTDYIIEFLIQNIWLVSIPIILTMDLVNSRFKRISNLLFIPLLAYLCYFTMYFITPHEIQWHLNTSFRRIIMHYIPVLAFLVCLIFSDEKLLKREEAI